MLHILDMIRSVVVDLLTIGLAIGVAVAVPIVLIMAWKTSRRRQLVVTELLNSTGHSDLDSVTRGLTQLARQSIDAEMLVVSERREELSNALRETASDHPGPGRWSRFGRHGKRAQLAPGRVQQRFNDQLDQLLTATRDAAPKEAQPAVQFLTVLVSRPRGWLVSGLLQRRDTAELQWGISFDVLRVDTNTPMASETFWEQPVTPSAADGDTEQARPHSPPIDAGPTQRIMALLRPAGRWLAIQLVIQSVFPNGAHGPEKGLDRLLSGMLYSMSMGGYRGFDRFFHQHALEELRDAAQALDEVPIRLLAVADTLDELAASARDAALGARDPDGIYREAHVQYARAVRAMEASSTDADPAVQHYRIPQAISWLYSKLPERQEDAFRWLEAGGPDLARQLPSDDLYDAAGLYALAANIRNDRQLAERAVQLFRQALALDADTPDRELWAQAERERPLAGVPIETLAGTPPGIAHTIAPLSPDELDSIIDQILAAEGNHSN
jgi:hypothetical protein